MPEGRRSTVLDILRRKAAHPSTGQSGAGYPECGRELRTSVTVLRRLVELPGIPLRRLDPVDRAHRPLDRFETRHRPVAHVSRQQRAQPDQSYELSHEREKPCDARRAYFIEPEGVFLVRARPNRRAPSRSSRLSPQSLSGGAFREDRKPYRRLRLGAYGPGRE